MLCVILAMIERTNDVPSNGSCYLCLVSKILYLSENNSKFRNMNPRKKLTMILGGLSILNGDVLPYQR